MKIKSLAKAIDILELVAWADGPVSLKSISSGLGLSGATASRLASDLTEAGLLRKSGYRSFEPALGMIHLGQRAMLNYVFPKKVNKILHSRCRSTGLQGDLAGVFKSHLVYLYNSAHDEATGRLGLPYTGQLFNSNIALVVLATKYGEAEALRLLRGSLVEKDSAFSKDAVNSFKGRLGMLAEFGYSFLDGGSYWNACMPLRWREETLGLALYGAPGEIEERDRLVFEVKRLRADIEEMLLNME